MHEFIPLLADDECMNNAFEKMCFTQEEWSDFFRSDYVNGKTGETFSEVLSRYLDEVQAKYGIRQQDVANISKVSTALITKYRNGSRKPTLNTVVILSIAMKLTTDRSEYLLHSAGYSLNDSIEHRIFKLFLYGCAFNSDYSVENCKCKLKEWRNERK